MIKLLFCFCFWTSRGNPHYERYNEPPRGLHLISRAHVTFLRTRYSHKVPDIIPFSSGNTLTMLHSRSVQYWGSWIVQHNTTDVNFSYNSDECGCVVNMWNWKGLDESGCGLIQALPRNFTEVRTYKNPRKTVCSDIWCWRRYLKGIRRVTAARLTLMFCHASPPHPHNDYESEY